MTDAPIAQTIHDGSGTPPEWRRKLIVQWLTAHGIRPKDVSADHPIQVLDMPYSEPSDEAAEEGTWAIQVIAFVQYIRNEQDDIAAHPETGQPLTIQRTVPLRHAFPTEHPTDGEAHGQAEREEAQQAVEEVVRDPQPAQVSDSGQVAREECSREGVGSRNESTEEAGSGSRDQEVPEPQEDQREEEQRPEEEVGGTR